MKNLICYAGALLLLVSLLFTPIFGCGGGNGKADSDVTGDLNEIPALEVTLNATEIAGVNGKLIYQGEEYENDLKVPANSLLGVEKSDGSIFLYHPSLGNVKLTDETSRKAVGFFIMSDEGSNLNRHRGKALRKEVLRENESVVLKKRIAIKYIPEDFCLIVKEDG